MWVAVVPCTGRFRGGIPEWLGAPNYPGVPLPVAPGTLVPAPVARAEQTNLHAPVVRKLRTGATHKVQCAGCGKRPPALCCNRRLVWRVCAAKS